METAEETSNSCTSIEYFCNIIVKVINRKHFSVQKVEEVIRKLHIQVDNLCQFLPQEQVQNFSRLKDKQLLTGTMKAVGNSNLTLVEVCNV